MSNESRVGGPSTHAHQADADGESASEHSVATTTTARRPLRRTSLTKHACARCQKQKSKCDGKRPSCKQCLKRGTGCTYTVADEGLTRMQDLQLQLQHRQNDVELYEYLIHALRYESDDMASNILARLRLADTVPDIVAWLRDKASMRGQDQYSPTFDGSGSQDHGPEHFFPRNERFPPTDFSWGNQSTHSVPQMLQMSPMESNPSPGHDSNEHHPH